MPCADLTCATCYPDTWWEARRRLSAAAELEAIQPSNDDDDEPRCPDCDCAECECGRDDDDGPGGLRDHDYKPRPQFFDVLPDGTVGVVPWNATTRFYGIELEAESCGSVTSPKKARQHIESQWQGLYCKFDGSLADGIEVVSHPFTFRAWAQLAANGLGWPRYLQQHRYLSYVTTTCGMHVHVSRAPLAESTIAKLLHFIDYHSETVTLWSRRRPGPLNQWARIIKSAAYRRDYAPGGSPHVRRVKGQVYDYNGEARYEAINLTNSHTIEFRLFRGTLLERAIMVNLGLCEALIDFMETTSRPSHFSSMERFRMHVVRLTMPVSSPNRTDAERAIFRNVLGFLDTVQPLGAAAAQEEVPPCA